MTKERITIYLPLLAVIVSVFSVTVAFSSAIAAYWVGRSQLNTGRSEEVTEALLEYTKQYQKIRSAFADDPFQIKQYVLLSDRQRSDVKITAGLLVQVVEDMRVAGDKRAGRWSDFIEEFSGPLYCGYPLDIYAGQERTIRLIVKDTNNIKQKARESGMSVEVCGGRQ